MGGGGGSTRKATSPIERGDIVRICFIDSGMPPEHSRKEPRRPAGCEVKG